MAPSGNAAILLASWLLAPLPAAAEGGHPWEWDGVAHLHGGKTYTWSATLADGDDADASMRLVIVPAADGHEETAKSMWERPLSQWTSATHGDYLDIGAGKPFVLQLTNASRATLFYVTDDVCGSFYFAAEHVPAEFGKGFRFFRDDTGEDVEFKEYNSSEVGHDHGHDHDHEHDHEHSHSDHEQDSTGSAFMSKWFFAAVLGVVALVGAGFAWTARRGGRTCVAIAEAFASGAMIAAALCHMLAHAALEMEGDDSAKCEEHQDDQSQHHGHSHGHGHGHESFPWPQLLCGLGFVFTHCLESVTHALLDKQLHKHGAKQDGCSAGDSIEAEGTSAAEEAVQTMQTSKRHGGAAGPLLMLALSFHSLMEGAALGAASASGALDVFIAILVHKGVAAFMLGVTLVAMRPSFVKYWLAMLWFACMTPVGVAIGQQLQGGQLGAILTAISAGTFLYIGAVESLPSPMGVTQGICFLGGFGLMAFLGKWA